MDLQFLYLHYTHLHLYLLYMADSLYIQVLYNVDLVDMVLDNIPLNYLIQYIYMVRTYKYIYYFL